MPAADMVERLARALSISPAWLAFIIGARELGPVGDGSDKNPAPSENS